MRMDLGIRQVKVYNSYFKQFFSGDVWVKDGKIFYVDEKMENRFAADRIVDGSGLFMIPGLIDIHMHIESSMMTPRAFTDYVRGCGVTTIVSEPHEIANVAGIEGIEEMIRAGEEAPIDIFYGIPSSVPSTSWELETTGGRIDCRDMERLMENPRVVCVGEVMSYRQIIRENNLEVGKFIKKLRERDRIFPIEGHCPSLVDLDLAKFLYLGINGDHTEHTIEELRQRFAFGMFVEIQEKMLKKEVLSFIKDNRLEEHFCFVTDDVMADTLVEQGQLNALVKRAIKLGMAPEQAVYNATYTPARRMNLLDRGVLAPGKLADFVLLGDVAEFDVEAVYKNGQAIWERNQLKGRGGAKAAAESGPSKTFPPAYYHSIRLEQQTIDALTVRTSLPDGRHPIKAIELNEKGTRTREKSVVMEVRDGLVRWQESECLLAAVLERYGKSGRISFGFLTGVCHQKGAVATSYAHDSHNLLAAGKTALEMLTAINQVIEMQGGMAVAEGTKILARLALPVGGILSDEPAETVGAGLKAVRTAMEHLGYRHYNPIMSFATITLPVSPSLKLTDRGMIDVEKSAITGAYILTNNVNKKYTGL